MQEVILALPLALIGIIAGIYWCAEIHDHRIAQLTAEQYAAMHQMRDLTFTKVMPPLRLVSLLAVAAALALALAPGWPRWLGVLVIACGIADVVVTLRLQVPLNHEVQSWRTTAIPAHWQRVRDRWASQHRLRLALGTLSYVALILAVFTTLAR
jgi:hypothetical protein